MEEHKTEIAYWAGRLIGYDQAWEVAAEIVESIKEAQSQALRKSDVISSLPICEGAHEIDKGMRVCKHCGTQYYHGQ